MIRHRVIRIFWGVCVPWRANAFTLTTPRFRSRNRTFRRKFSIHVIAISALGIHLQPGKTTMTHVLRSALVGMVLLQNPTLDSSSPKERQAAIEEMAVLGNTKAIPALAAAYKKEPKSDLRAEMLVGLARI